MWHPQEQHVKCEYQPAYLKCSACSYGESPMQPLWIVAFRNGDEMHNGTRILVSPTYLKNFDNLLECLTKQLKPKFGAVRKIYSPNSGSSVRCLRDLKPNHKYVVAGREKLRRMPLGYLTEEERELQIYKRKIKAQRCREVYSNTEQSESPRGTPRYWMEAERRRRGTIVIFVHRNGDSFGRPLRLVLTEKDRKSHTWWGPTVQQIENRLGVHSIRTFYTRCGKEVHTPYGLRNGRAYVAICKSEKFTPVPYRSPDGVPFACCLEKDSICHHVKSLPEYCESHYLKEQILGGTQTRHSTEEMIADNVNEIYLTEVEYTQNGKKLQHQTKESHNTEQSFANNAMKSENDSKAQFKERVLSVETENNSIDKHKNDDENEKAIMQVKNEAGVIFREVSTQFPEKQQPIEESKLINNESRKSSETNTNCCLPCCKRSRKSGKPKQHDKKPVHEREEVNNETAKGDHPIGMDEVALLHQRQKETETKQAGDFKRRGKTKGTKKFEKRHRPLFKIRKKGQSHVFPACRQKSRLDSKMLAARDAAYETPQNYRQTQMQGMAEVPHNTRPNKSRYMISVRWEKVEMEIDPRENTCNSSDESDADSVFSNATFTMCSPDFTDVDYRTWKITGKVIGRGTAREGWICTTMDCRRKKKLDCHTAAIGHQIQKTVIISAILADVKLPHSKNAWIMQKKQPSAIRRKREFTKCITHKVISGIQYENKLSNEDLALEHEYLNEEFEDYTEGDSNWQV